MPVYTHGGDVWGRPHVLDFSANLHPLGIPPAVAVAAQAAVLEAIHYPDPTCRELRGGIAARDGVRMQQVICGNGAADLIFRLCLALKPARALITAPTFSEYETALTACGCAVRRWPLEEKRAFDLDETLLTAMDDGLDLIFLCNPNNPTGRLIDPACMAHIISRCGKTNTRLVVDECFLPLTDGQSLTGELEKYPHLFLLRAFTKTYAIPGLRLGYGLCADEELLERLAGTGQPWPVSNVAQAAGIAACGCVDWPERGKALLRQERPRLISALRAFGFTVWEGEANYLLFRTPGLSDLRERLLKEQVLIRSCGNYIGLSSEYYRVCVRTPEKNQILTQAIERVL